MPGTMGIVLTVIGSQAAASLVVREKEAGTIEQLMMTPASNTEVIPIQKMFATDRAFKMKS
ncbi:ABC transporter permease subunit [Nostoc sp. T09]|uniref:ABC transporter permease subunit n=1 Tax=Nostoc sp. T09 TaxID=1932621 RepID=UPI00277D06CB|nr:ABC transporter permease subunit [Nostoc sp. T09]